MKCPTCKQDYVEPKAGERSYFPFCSERCKLIDLGRWLEGRYQVPVRETDDSENPTPDLHDDEGA